MKLKQEKYEDLTRPVQAFITFAEEEGYQTALRFEEPEDPDHCRNPKLLGEPLYFEDATEPTNIIWENRYMTTLDIVWRSFCVISACGVLLVCSFIVIFMCQQEAIAIKLKYPMVDCDEIITTYGKAFESVAYSEFMNYYKTDKEDPTPMAGALKCFCEREAGENGAMSTWGKKYTVRENPPQELCTDWYWDQWKSMLSGMVGYFIIGINFVLRLVLIGLICLIGQHTESTQTNSITNGVLLVQFFNTAVLLLFVNANMTQQSTILGYAFKGNLPDFSYTWYQETGNTLTGAMIFNIGWPIIEFFVFWFQREGLRIVDRGLSGFAALFTAQEESTKTITIYQYVELYSGPVYMIHYKYAAILNVTLIAFMFGAGLPVLWPVSCASMAVLYGVEKAMIYYSYRQPPVYDAELNDSVLGILAYAPILYYSFGYWMFSNKQIFSNDIVWRGTLSEREMTNHLWDDTLTNLDETLAESYCLPLFCCFWVVLVATFFREKILEIICDIFPNFAIANFDVDEDLDPFFETLDEKAKDWFIKEEKNSRDILKFAVMDDENFENI